MVIEKMLLSLGSLERQDVMYTSYRNNVLRKGQESLWVRDQLEKAFFFLSGRLPPSLSVGMFIWK